MKLSDLKGALIQQFFKAREGADEMNVSEVIAALGAQLKEDVSYFESISDSPTHSHEPSKAFAKFTSGRRALLLIEEEEPFKNVMIYGALRSGNQVVTLNLTDEADVKPGSLGEVKEALRQAFAFNDEIVYSIFNEASLFDQKR